MDELTAGNAVTGAHAKCRGGRSVASKARSTLAAASGYAYNCVRCAGTETRARLHARESSLAQLGQPYAP